MPKHISFKLDMELYIQDENDLILVDAIIRLLIYETHSFG